MSAPLDASASPTGLSSLRDQARAGPDHTASIPSAIALWKAAVQNGDDYPCKYWGIAACAFHYGHNCGCSFLDEYRAIAAGSGTDETSEAQAQAEGSQSGPKGIAQGIAP